MNMMRPPLLVVALVFSMPLSASDKKDIAASRKILYEIADGFNAAVAADKTEMPEIDRVYHSYTHQIDRLTDLPKEERMPVRDHIEATHKQVKKLHSLLAHFHEGARHDNLSKAIERMEQRWEDAHKEMAKLDKVPQARKNAADSEMINALKIMHQALESREGEQHVPAHYAPQVERKRVVAREVAQPSGRAAKTVALPVERERKAGEAAAARVEQQKKRTTAKKVKGSKELYPGVE